MTDARRRVERAIRWAPEADRVRYAEEWRHDMASAASSGHRADDVARAAARMAVDLRLRWWARVLLGGAGASRAVTTWMGLLVLVVAAFLLGGIVLLFLAGVALVLGVVFALAGTPSHWSHWLVVASVVLGAGSGAFSWWALGASVDADDAFRPQPAATAWIGTDLLVFLASGLLLIVAAVVAVRREGRIHRAPH